MVRPTASSPPQRYGQSAQPAADRAAQRLIQRRRWAAPAASWAARPALPAPRGLGNALERTLRLASPIRPPGGQAVSTGSAALRPCHWFRSPPIPPHGGLCCGALRVRWVAVLGLRLAPSLPARGALAPLPAPRPPGAVPVLALQPQTPRGLRWLRAGPARPSAPRGSQAAKNPRPARRDHSVAAGWACAVKAQPCAALRVAQAPALTAPTPLLAQLLPPGRKTGWGLSPNRTGGAPGGRGVAPCPHDTRSLSRARQRATPARPYAGARAGAR
jgi:hypothetical protein